jgi:hypothetical protein
MVIWFFFLAKKSNNKHDKGYILKKIKSDEYIASIGYWEIRIRNINPYWVLDSFVYFTSSFWYRLNVCKLDLIKGCVLFGEYEIKQFV